MVNPMGFYGYACSQRFQKYFSWQMTWVCLAVLYVTLV